MTAQETLQYLREAQNAHTLDDLTRIKYLNAEEAIVHFYLKHQTTELYQQNRWRIATLNAPEELIETDGEFFSSLEPA